MMSLTTTPITAFHIADNIDLKRVRQAHTAKPTAESSSELFYSLENDSFCYITNYGVVVFANMSEVDMSKNIQWLNNYCDRLLQEKMREDFEINTTENTAIQFKFNSLEVPVLDEKVVRIVMFNVAQSAALDYYDKTSEYLLAEVRQHAEHLEKTGGLQLNKKNMLRFIGKALNNKNRIAENLYLFDSPDQTWEDEYLDKIHRGLVKTFDLSARFREIEYTFRIVGDNLDVFSDIYRHRESAMLEWIIIGLILIEVADLVLTRLLAW
jgi:uncharacterized Rmd1/YagE family protein